MGLIARRLPCPAMADTAQEQRQAFRVELGRVVRDLREGANLTPTQVVGRAAIPRFDEVAVRACERADGPTTVRAFVAICDGLERWPQDVLDSVVLHAPRPASDPRVLSGMSAAEFLAGNLSVDDFVAACEALRLDPGQAVAHLTLFVKASLATD